MPNQPIPAVVPTTPSPAMSPKLDAIMRKKFSPAQRNILRDIYLHGVGQLATRLRNKNIPDANLGNTLKQVVGDTEAPHSFSKKATETLRSLGMVSYDNHRFTQYVRLTAFGYLYCSLRRSHGLLLACVRHATCQQ